MGWLNVHEPKQGGEYVTHLQPKGGLLLSLLFFDVGVLTCEHNEHFNNKVM